jgi:uncharacterized protein YbjT (DUF2867 family)
MHVSVRRYTIGAGSIDALAHRIDEEFAPALRQEPGFVGYIAMITGERDLETVSVFMSQAAAERSDELAAEYVADNLGAFELTCTERTGGPVLASRAVPAILDPARRKRTYGPRPGAVAGGGAPVLVIGATGRTGRRVVDRLATRGLRVRALVRDPARGRELLPDSVEQIAGDLRRPETLASAVAGAGAIVVSTSGGSDRDNSAVLIDYFGTEHVMREAARAGVDLVVFVSSIYATRPDYYLDVEPSSLGWKARAEEVVRASGVPYCIVRAGWLTDGPGGAALALSQGDVGEGQLTRSDLAAVCERMLFLDSARGKTFEVVAAHHGETPPPLETAIAALRPDMTPSATLTGAPA